MATQVCITAQHRHLLDQVLQHFDVQPDYDLDLMTPGQSLSEVTGRILLGLEDVLARLGPDMVLVQGDTTTTMAGALAAFYHRIPVGHVEAGLRTGDLLQPFPEELNRVFTSRLATLHFAPTPRAAANLRAEGVPEASIAVTGNTGIDALLYTCSQLESGAALGFSGPAIDDRKSLILVTAHRRESFGLGFDGICQALKTLAGRPNIQIIYPVHPNPNVRASVMPALGTVPGIHLIEPQEYVQFVDLLRRADLILTDSGGIQEEAPSLGKPVLVLREKTERQEALEAGTARLVGTNPDRIVSAALMALSNKGPRTAVSNLENPFGDGHACGRIRILVDSFLMHGVRQHPTSKCLNRDQ